MSDVPDLGRYASVVIDRETEEPTTLQFGRSGEGMRSLDDEFEGDPERPETMVDEFNVVSAWTLQVALYALQNPTPENLRKALSMIGTSGDCEEHIDHETLRPLPVSEPPGWDNPIWVHEDDPAAQQEAPELQRWTVSRDLPEGIEPDSLGGLVKVEDAWNLRHERNFWAWKHSLRVAEIEELTRDQPAPTQPSLSEVREWLKRELAGEYDAEQHAAFERLLAYMEGEQG